MLGPLPRLYRLILVLVAPAVCVGAFAWLAWFTPVPIVAGAGALIGLAAGLVAAYLLIHQREPRLAGVRRR